MTPTFRKALTGAAIGFGMITATVAATGSPVSAAKPVVVVDETIVEEFVVPASEFVCGVDAHIQQTIKIRVTDYFDKDGNFVRGIAHLNGTTRVTTENGTAVDRWSQTDFFDPEALTVTTAGSPYNVHVPGSGTGVLVNDAGLLTFDVTTGEVQFVAGPHRSSSTVRQRSRKCAPSAQADRPTATCDLGRSQPPAEIHRTSAGGRLRRSGDSASVR